VCGPESLEATKFSAAGYFFGRKIHRELKLPVGMIDASVGGSMIEPWTPPGGFASAPALAAWAKAAQAPPATVDVYQGVKVMPVEPCTMYRAMIAPLAPFALRGVLWYQGESNVYSGDTDIYADKMTALIQGWRSAWGRELPFYYVQIAPLYYHTTRSDKVVSPEAEPRLWEAQASCLRLPHTGMVVTTDLVEDLTDIHPRNKKEVGERLARWALAQDYGRADVEPSGPIFRSMELNGDKAVLHFDHLGGGLVCKGSRGLNWFVIAGSDGELFPAAATIEGDTIVVTSPRVPKPAVVRFGWDEAAQPNLFNKAGLPAIPFRTDSPFAREPLSKPLRNEINR
jgi:sialate O-acetylesterase